MMKRSVTAKVRAEQVVKDIRRATRKFHSSDNTIRIVLSGLRGEDHIAELCRKKALPKACVTVAPRRFLRLARGGWPTTRPAYANAGAVKDLCAAALALKEPVADPSLENRLLKENMTGAGGAGECDLQRPRSLRSSGWGSRRICLSGARISIPPSTFYRWYDRFVEHGSEGLEDRPPSRLWSRIPEAVRDRIPDLVLEAPELSPREPAVRFTDTEKCFVSEASVYCPLKPHDLITSPACVVIKAADAFRDKTTAPNQMWQTGFTCPRSSTTPATPSAGNSAATCGARMSPTHSTSLWPRQGSV